MEKLENISEDSLVVSNVEKPVMYKAQDRNYQEFNPQYEIQEESLNVNPLSARSCRCRPCRC